MKKTALICLGALMISCILIVNGFSNNDVVAGNDDESKEYEYEYYYNNDKDEDSVMEHAISRVKPQDESTDNEESKTEESADSPDSNDAVDTDSMQASNNGEEPQEGDLQEDAGNNGDSAIPVDTEPDSITVFVNKDYALPGDYVPDDLVKPDVNYYNGLAERRYLRKEASKALEKMFEAAKEDGIYLYGVSGYRSYARQKTIYGNNINRKGKNETNKASAKPGHSEHQTGLSIDISISSLGGDLVEEFGTTDAGKWVAKNGHKYGFIIRYPKGKEKVTGYSYEPWHIRYVGKDLAKYLYKNKLTMEEYYGYKLSEGEMSEITSDTVNP